jgi:hypothetical protein
MPTETTKPIADDVVDTSWTPPCQNDCSHLTLFRASLHMVVEMVDAWNMVVATDGLDVGDPGERHIAGARVIRTMCVRARHKFGHPMPASVVPCAVSVISDESVQPFEADDHLVVVTGRAVADVGLAARCAPMLADHVPIVIERVGAWPSPRYTAALEFEQGYPLQIGRPGVTVTYRPNANYSYRRSPLWRRTNRGWEEVLGALNAACDDLFQQRGSHASRDWPHPEGRRWEWLPTELEAMNDATEQGLHVGESWPGPGRPTPRLAERLWSRVIDTVRRSSTDVRPNS